MKQTKTIFKSMTAGFLFVSTTILQAQTVEQNWATLASGASPWSINVDASGNVYTANIVNKTVSKITANGTVTPAWATLANTSYPYGIAADASGNVYTANYNNTVSKITANRTVTLAWATLASNATPMSIALDASGNLYTANFGNNTVSKITADGTVTDAWATLANHAQPQAIAIDALGNVYTANPNNNTVSKITADGTVTQAWATLASSAFPFSITVDASGNVYTSNQSNNTVSKITANGTVTQAWATLASGTTPRGIAEDALGNVYTANQGNGTVSKITANGTVTQTWVTLASGAQPFGLAIDVSGNLYTANSGNNTVSKITIATPNAPSNLEGNATSTSSITLTWNDVADEDNYRIEYKKSADDTYIILATINANVTSYVAGNLLCNNAYDFQVIALGHGTQSAPSTITQLKPLSLDVPEINSSSTESCTGSSIVISAPVGFASYHWSNDETTQTINAERSGDYSVQVTDAGGCISDYSQPVVITFYNYPDATISQTDNVLQTSVVADSYQWYFNNNPIENETTNLLTLTQSGTYKLELRNHSCTSWSREIMFVAPVTTGVNENASESIAVFPNPSTGEFTVSVPAYIGDYHITIFDLAGKVLYKYSGEGETQLKIPGTTAGLYMLVIESHQKILAQKIVFN